MRNWLTKTGAHALRLGVVLTLAMAAHAASAQSFGSQTRLVDLQHGSGSSALARNMSIGGYELMDGTDVSFRDWYSTDMEEVRATWFTQVNDNFGLFWGLGTGEQGEKYTIDPSVTLGFHIQKPLKNNSTLSLQLTGIIGGWISEDSCTADYGAIGGVQTVNCRLAASVMRPADTLDYMVNQPPQNRYALSPRFERRF